MTRINVLASFLDVEVEDIQNGYDQFMFETDEGEFLVLTDQETDAKAKLEILESAWAFNQDFIIQHSKSLDYDQASYDILTAIQEKCESGNDAILRLIDDIDEFAENAISLDGRGHFLNRYDGSEEYFQGFYIYRTN